MKTAKLTIMQPTLKSLIGTRLLYSNVLVNFQWANPKGVPNAGGAGKVEFFYKLSHSHLGDLNAKSCAQRLAE